MAKLIDKIEISDALIERPIGFSFRRRHFSIFPPTLGKIQLISRSLEKMRLTDTKGNGDIYQSILRAVIFDRQECKRLLAYYTLEGSECLDEKKVMRRMKSLRWMAESDLATSLLIALTMDKSEEIMQFFGLDKEAERLTKVIQAKGENKNSVDFAGKSIWGTMIDSACERYGWTYQYVLWGISYCSLKMLLSDQVKTVFLTDEERKRAGAAAHRQVINADDTATLENFIKHQNWN